MGKDDLRDIQLIGHDLNELEHNKDLSSDYIELNMSDMRKMITGLESIKQEWRDDFIDKTLDLESHTWHNGLDEYFYFVIKEMQSLYQQISDDYLQTPDLSISMVAEALDDEWLMCPYCVDAWKSMSKDAMVLCPMCTQTLHNPRFTQS